MRANSNFSQGPILQKYFIVNLCFARFEVSWLAIQYFPANQSAPNQQSVILFKEILYGRFKDQNPPLEKNSSLDLR